MGANLTKESYLKMVKELSADPKKVALQKKNPEFIDSEWKRLSNLNFGFKK